MKPLAMTMRLVIDDKRKLAAEIEVVWDTGDVSTRHIDANQALIVHFEDMEREIREKKV